MLLKTEGEETTSKLNPQQFAAIFNEAIKGSFKKSILGLVKLCKLDLRLTTKVFQTMCLFWGDRKTSTYCKFSIFISVTQSRIDSGKPFPLGENTEVLSDVHESFHIYVPWDRGTFSLINSLWQEILNIIKGKHFIETICFSEST